MAKEKQTEPAFTVEPVSDDRKDWLYSSQEKDAERGCIGHLRMDMGSDGGTLWSTWWPHNADLRTPDFVKELQEVVTGLCKKDGPLSDLKGMRKFCYQSDSAQLDSSYHSFGFQFETEKYQYALRLTPSRGEYSYLYCYDKQGQLEHAQRPSVRNQLQKGTQRSDAHKASVPTTEKRGGR